MLYFVTVSKSDLVLMRVIPNECISLVYLLLIQLVLNEGYLIVNYIHTKCCPQRNSNRFQSDYTKLISTVVFFEIFCCFNAKISQKILPKPS